MGVEVGRVGDVERDGGGVGEVAARDFAVERVRDAGETGKDSL